MKQVLEEKARVPGEFDAVAPRYDLMVSLNPGYSRHLRISAERLDVPQRKARILDLCCGTGLSTLALAEVFPDAELTGLDGSAGMLERARKKRGLERVRFFQGDATDPAHAGVGWGYDGIFMAYGIRNIGDPDRCLRAIYDLLKPGGSLCFHEYSVADSRIARAIWNTVAGGVIVPLGMLTSPGSDLYRYLRRSVNDFDGVGAFEDRLRKAGFANVHTLPMSGWQRGIVHSFVCRRPA